MGGETALFIGLFGAPMVRRTGVVVPLPRSRKVRGLLAYLALQRQGVSRSRLCDLLWNVPNDPRGELRWCLSKLRGLLDDQRRRVITLDDAVSLDLTDCRVDALEVDAALRSGLDGVPHARLCELNEMFAGDLLDNEPFDGYPEFSGWLAGQRNRFRALRISVVQALAQGAPSADEKFRRLDSWLQLAPFDVRPHQVLLELLVQTGRLRDADEHLATTVQAFEGEGVDWSELRDVWRRTRSAAPPLAQASRVEISEPRVVTPGQSRRASIAVLPFSDTADHMRIGDGLTEDIILQLAKLRVLFVIARGSVFALGDRGLSPQEAGRLLHVDYVVTGAVRRDRHARVAVELVDVRDDHIVWTDELDADDTFSVLDSIVQRIVAGIAEEIELAESRRAVLKPPSSLDAWEAYHRGLWHMYKFTGPDNHHAAQLFSTALELDPTFSRAYAGRSFTHFQNAFLSLTSDRERQIALAFESAAQSLAADDHDPAAHWAMGRALWLQGEGDGAVAELERSIHLSPNFALGHYTLGFVRSQIGDPRAAIEATNYARQLSPFDPLQFAMLASRALAHARMNDCAEAADWAVRATARPNAHAHILAIASVCLSLADRRDEARRFVARIRDRLPAYSVDDFLRAFRFEPDTHRRLWHAARSIDFAG